MAILMLSVIPAAIMISPVKAQAQYHTAVPLGNYAGGPLPSGVTPSLSVPTIPYISFSPNPDGVNQNLLVNLWLQPTLPVQRAHTGYTVVITKPDGSKDTIGPLDSYVGDTTAYFDYTVTQAGNYTIQFSFAGDYYPAGYYILGQKVANGNVQYPVGGPPPVLTNATFLGDCYYQPSQSAVYTLVVQQNYVPRWPPTPLPGPGEYWSRPINPDNREWWIIGGFDPNNEAAGPDWPANTNTYTSNYAYNFVPYVTGPTSAHIVWRMASPMAISGILGAYFSGEPTLYQAGWEDFNGVEESFGNTGPGTNGNPNICFDGRCYQVLTEPFNGITQNVWTCYDIQTGKVYWQLTGITNPPTLVSIAQANGPVPGATNRAALTSPLLLYLSANLVTEYNPANGAVVLNYTTPTFSSSTLYADPYVISVQTIGTQHYLVNWTLDGIGTGPFANQIQSNITWPFTTIGYPDYQTGISGQVYSATLPQTGVAGNVWIAAASLTTGQLLWNESSGVGYSVFTNNEQADHGMMAVRFDNGHWYAWNLQTGTLAWQSEQSSYPWGVFGAYHSESAYGLLYYEQYDGVVAWNWTTGQIAWWFQAPATAEETPYTNGTGQLNGQVYSFFTNAILADGQLYTYSEEHSPSAPLSRGWSIYDINATTGQEIWSTLGSMSAGVISDGYMTATDFYNGYLNVFGMGLSTTTVSAPQTAVTAGTPILISGTVLDQSPAQPGTACVSDASMGDWMAYLHEQAPHPTTVTGVPIVIQAISPDGTLQNIATVTSDGTTGTFAYTWTTPTTPGQYEIYATFVGDDSYAASTASTYATVTQAPTVTATPTPTVTATSNLATNASLMTYIVAATIAIIIAIAIVGVLLLRKRP